MPRRGSVSCELRGHSDFERGIVTPATPRYTRWKPHMCESMNMSLTPVLMCWNYAGGPCAAPLPFDRWTLRRQSPEHQKSFPVLLPRYLGPSYTGPTESFLTLAQVPSLLVIALASSMKPGIESTALVHILHGTGMLPRIEMTCNHSSQGQRSLFSAA